MAGPRRAPAGAAQRRLGARPRRARDPRDPAAGRQLRRRRTLVARLQRRDAPSLADRHGDPRADRRGDDPLRRDHRARGRARRAADRRGGRPEPHRTDPQRPPGHRLGRCRRRLSAARPLGRHARAADLVGHPPARGAPRRGHRRPAAADARRVPGRRRGAARGPAAVGRGAARSAPGAARPWRARRRGVREREEARPHLTTEVPEMAHVAPTYAGTAEAAIDDQSRYWWVLLITGSLWSLFGLIVFRFDYTTVAALSVLLGTVCIAASVLELAAAFNTHGWARVG